MTTDNDFDAFLADQLAETPLPGDSFTRAIGARLDRQRRVRRGIVAGVTAIASIIVIFAMAGTEAPLLSVVTVTPQTTVAILVLTALCCAVWIAAESRPPALRAVDPRR